MSTPNLKQKNHIELTFEETSFLESLLEGYRTYMEIDQSNEESVKKREIQKIEELERKLTGTEQEDDLVY
jgi:hypothetical protein